MFCGPWMNWKRVTVKGSGSCFQDWEERLAEQQSSSGEFGAVSVLGMELRQGNHKDVGTRHLVFVRHAQPGHGEPLSDVGLQQAELLAQRLSVQTSDAKYKVVFHSPAPEAKATAKILKQCFGKVKMKESSLLAEDVPMVPSPAPATWRGAARDEQRHRIAESILVASLLL
ncbi:unnamed protein product, partial [Durusdinium trenchii]